MVALKSHEADRFLSRDIGGFAAYLVFGADAGLVSERVRHLLAALVDDPADPFQLVRLTGDDVVKDPARLADEAGTVPLFGGRRAVHLDAGSKPVAPALELLLTLRDPAPVVIEAGALKKDAALRKAAERSKLAVALECSPDEERDLLRLIDDEVNAAGLAIAPDARQTMAALLGADRRASRSELAKLVLYARDAGTITVDHVEDIVADASAVATDALVDATFLGNLPALDIAFRKSVTGNADAGTVLAAAARHANWLHRTKIGGSAEAALGQLARYGISFKRKPAIERQLKAADATTLFRAATRLGEAVGQVRRNPDLAQSLAGRALWSVALSLREPNRRG